MSARLVVLVLALPRDEPHEDGADWPTERERAIRTRSGRQLAAEYEFQYLRPRHTETNQNRASHERLSSVGRMRLPNSEATRPAMMDRLTETPLSDVGKSSTVVADRAVRPMAVRGLKDAISPMSTSESGAHTIPSAATMASGKLTTAYAETQIEM